MSEIVIIGAAIIDVLVRPVRLISGGRYPYVTGRGCAQ